MLAIKNIRHVIFFVRISFPHSVLRHDVLCDSIDLIGGEEPIIWWWLATNTSDDLLAHVFLLILSSTCKCQQIYSYPSLSPHYGRYHPNDMNDVTLATRGRCLRWHHHITYKLLFFAAAYDSMDSSTDSDILRAKKHWGRMRMEFRSQPFKKQYGSCRTYRKHLKCDKAVSTTQYRGVHLILYSHMDDSKIGL